MKTKPVPNKKALQNEGFFILLFILYQDLNDAKSSR